MQDSCCNVLRCSSSNNQTNTLTIAPTWTVEFSSSPPTEPAASPTEPSPEDDQISQSSVIAVVAKTPRGIDTADTPRHFPDIGSDSGAVGTFL